MVKLLNTLENGGIIRICRDCHQEIHGNIPRRGELVDLARKYRKYLSLKNSLNSWNRAFEHTTGNNDPKIKEMAEYLDEKRMEFINLMYEIVKEDADRIMKIKGIGKRMAVELLAFANPRWFDSLSAYLAFIGCKKSTKHKSNWNLHALRWLMTRGLFMCKNEKYYPMYRKFKESGLKHGCAQNRISTFLMKEIFCIFKTPLGKYTVIEDGKIVWKGDDDKTGIVVGTTPSVDLLSLSQKIGGWEEGGGC